MEMMQRKLADPGHTVSSLREFLSHDENVLFALLFGSYASGRQTPKSDIDLAVYFLCPPSGLGVLDLLNRLSSLSPVDVDLIVLNTASPFLRHQVLRYGRPLVVKDRVLYRVFREKTMSEYDEYKHVAGMPAYD